MPWLESSEEILISREEYYEQRNYRDDPEKPQRRLRRVRVYEYRGLTQSAAEGLVAPSLPDAESTITWSAQRQNEAGAYMAIKTEDTPVGGWNPVYIG